MNRNTNTLFRVSEDKASKLLADLKKMIKNNHDVENTPNSHKPYTSLYDFLSIELPRYIEGADGEQLNSGIIRSRLAEAGVITREPRLQTFLCGVSDKVLNKPKTGYLDSIEGLDAMLPLIDKLPNKKTPNRIIELPDMPNTKVTGRKDSVQNRDEWFERQQARTRDR